MQTLKHKNLKIIYILITENISFIPRNILNRCQLIPFKRPTKSAYSRVTSKSLMNDINIKNVVNIKDIKSKVRELHNMNKIVCDKILHLIKNYQEIQFLHLRDLLYDIFIYNLNIHTCLYYIVNNLVTESYLNEDTIEKIFIKLFKFLKLYNNNYRPIYHLESFIFYLCIVIHEL